MKRFLWLEVALIGAIFLLTVGVGGYIILKGDSKFQSASVSAKSEQLMTGNAAAENEVEQALIELPSDFEGIRLFKETSNDPATPYSLVYPSTDFKPINKEITSYIETAKQQYIAAIEQNNGAVSSKLSIDVKVSSYKQTYLSLLLTKKVSFNKKYVEQSDYTLFFNRKTGELIDAKKLFAGNEQHLQKLAKYVHQKMLSQPAAKTHINKKNWNIASYPYWKNYNRFAIINDSLILYYDQGAFADASVSSLKLSIPISFINPILAPEFRSNVNNGLTILTPLPKEATGKLVALTFDDGPHKKVTKQILSLLEKYDAKATFFLVGNQVAGNESIVKDILAKGHEIGNHSWNHANLPKLSSNNIKAQINKTNTAIFNATGQYPTVFRPPYGEVNEAVAELSTVPIVMWSIDTLDWKYRDARKLLPKVKSTLKNNDIILMHDIHQSTADGLESVLVYLQKEGYECVTVSELHAYQHMK